MSKKNFKLIYTLDEIQKVVDKLYSLMSECSVFTFTGTLGAGKTTLIKHLLKKCGVEDVIVSPTFTYMAQYANYRNEIFYHFDLYRIKTLQEFYDAGFDEFLYKPKSWVFIEWPEIIMPILKKDVCHINIDYDIDHETESDKISSRILLIRCAN